MKNIFYLFIINTSFILVINCTSRVPYAPQFQQFSKSPNVNAASKPTQIKPIKKNDVFPYELIPDTITALTCPGNVHIGNRIFSLKLGAYANHGLKLTPAFLQANNITKSTNPNRVLDILNKSPYKDASARFALQDESNLQSIYQDPSNGRNIESRFPAFNNPTTLSNLSQLQSVFTTRSSSVKNVGRGGKFESNLNLSGQNLYHFSEGLSITSSGTYLLTLTYFLPNAPLILNKLGLPLGRGYKLGFNDIAKINYLTEIEEDNLDTTQKEGDWHCPEDLVIPVHRAETEKGSNFNRTYQNYKPVPGLYSESYCNTSRPPRIDSRISRFFKNVFGTDIIGKLPFKLGEAVYFDKSNTPRQSSDLCLVFNKSGCYPTQYMRIEFDPSKNQQCKSMHNILSDSDRYNVCPGYLSVCYRFK